MSEMMVAITGSVIVKSVLILAVLEAAQYFHNKELLWWWILVLFAGITYKHSTTENSEEGKDGSNEG